MFNQPIFLAMASFLSIICIVFSLIFAAAIYYSIRQIRRKRK